MFSPEEKEIFSYRYGPIKAKADPLAIRRKLVSATRGNLDKLLDQAFGNKDDQQSIVDRHNAIGLLIQAASTTFNIPLWNPETNNGFTEEMVFDVIKQFDEWFQKKS